jgi:predicted dithiol-disulfide oxidoreductase (DUF899 family)
MEMAALAKSAPQALQHIHFPNEGAEYRQARNALLEQEMELRRQVERVAAQRRALPPGGKIPEDYVFEAAGAGGNPKRMRLSELFAPGKDTLAIYSFMFGPERERPCPGCTHFLDGLDGACRHISQRINLVVVAKSPVPRIVSFAEERGWRWLQLLSTAGNDYDRDYFGDSTGLSRGVREQQEFRDGEEWDMPILNFFRRSPGRSTATMICWIRSGPCSTLRRRGGEISNPNWTTLRAQKNDSIDRHCPVRALPPLLLRRTDLRRAKRKD